MIMYKISESALKHIFRGLADFRYKLPYGMQVASASKLQQAAVCLLLVLFPLFFIGGPEYQSNRSFQTFWDLGHIVFYFVASWLLRDSYCRKSIEKTGYYCFARVFSIVALTGIAVELLQIVQTDRNSDLLDLVRNQLGCLLLFLTVSPSPVRGRLLFFLRGCALLGVLLCLVPLVQALLDEQSARQQFPLLADFESSLELSRWGEPRKISLDRSLSRHGAASMSVRLMAGKYSGTSLVHFPHDWSGYQTLHFSVYSPGSESLDLHCRIHDRLHKENGQKYADRFNTTFCLQQGWNDIVIPLSEVDHAPAGRCMDMENIKGFGLFVMEQKKPLSINLDYVYLK